MKTNYSENAWLTDEQLKELSLEGCRAEYARMREKTLKGMADEVQQQYNAMVKGETLKSMSEGAQPKEFSQKMFENAYNVPQGMEGLDGPNGTVMPTYDELETFQY